MILKEREALQFYLKIFLVTYKDTKINIIDTPGHADFEAKLKGF